jgi:uncharacterized protein
MTLVIAFLVGLLFGLGLLLSGMANPAKVLAFLDLAGSWDPSLLFVMAGAIAVGLVAFSFVLRRKKTLLGLPMRMPRAAHIEPRLIIGSLLFGAGWGLAGFCPGPALVALGAGYAKALAFVCAMVVGMALFEYSERMRRATAEQTNDT